MFCNSEFPERDECHSFLGELNAMCFFFRGIWLHVFKSLINNNSCFGSREKEINSGRIWDWRCEQWWKQSSWGILELVIIRLKNWVIWQGWVIEVHTENKKSKFSEPERTRKVKGL